MGKEIKESGSIHLRRFFCYIVLIFFAVISLGFLSFYFRSFFFRSSFVFIPHVFFFFKIPHHPKEHNLSSLLFLT